MSDTPAQTGNTRLQLSAPRAIYFLLFTVSGFAGLIYESIWSHYLKLFLGHAAYAQSLVLIIFMGGMALGAYLASRLSVHWKSLLLAYAGVELIVGVAALVFHPLFQGATGYVYTSVLPAIGSVSGGTTLKFLIASALILPQSVLLGMTFPLMSAGIIRRFPDTPGGSISMLYFTNSLGAALGVLASGFWFIAAVGLPGTMLTAGLLNILLAVVVIALVRLDPVGEKRPATRSESSTGWSLLAKRCLAAAFITGMASFIYEIGWIRMLSLVLGSTTHSFELMLSAFILGLAFGGLWIRRRIDRISEPMRFSGYVQLIMGALALLTLPVYLKTFDLMSWLLSNLQPTAAGFATYNFASHAIALIVMLPTTFMAGMTLPLFTFVMLKKGEGERSIGSVYAANTVGAVVGVLFAVHIGLPMLGLKQLIVVGAALDIALGLYLLHASGGAGLRKRTLQAAAVGVVLLGVATIGVSFDQQLLSSGVYRHGSTETLADADIRYYRDGKTATITLSDHADGTVTLSTNGKPDAAIQIQAGRPYSRDEITMGLLGSLPIAYRPDATKVAVIGMGSGMTTHTVLAYEGIDVVDTIEIEPFMVEASRKFGAAVSRAYDDPRSRIIIDDAKSYISLRRERYDIITAEPSNPWVSGVASLFSTEFYAAVGDVLADNGLFMQWIQLYEFNDDLAISILKALSENFADFVLYSADDGNVLLIASKNGELRQPDWSALFESGLADTLRRVDINNEQDLLIRRIADRASIERFLDLSPVPANSDFFPYVDLNAGKARFESTQALLFSRWLDADLPMAEMLHGDELVFADMTRTPWLSRYVTTAVAEHAYRRITGEGASVNDVAGMPRRDPLATTWAVLDSPGGDCPQPEQLNNWLAAIDSLVRWTLPSLSSPDALAMLGALDNPECELLQIPAVAGRFDFLRAVAARDAEAMRTSGRVLLESFGGQIPRDFRYVLGATMLGDIAAGDVAAARDTWERFAEGQINTEYLPEYLQLLLAMTTEALNPG